MARACALARAHEGHTRPNPPVGAVIIQNGRLIGEGAHVRCGCAHAEVAALSSCTESPKGATVYCTLEPCSKPGRVGACCDALIASGVACVDFLQQDPNPVNAGAAQVLLTQAGIETHDWSRAPTPEQLSLVREGASLIAPFTKFIRTQRPYVTVKLAMTLDGRIADCTGNAKWISSPRAREQTDRLRQRVDVIMVGAETVRRDNPSLLCHQAPNPDLWRAVISHSGCLPHTAQILTDEAKDRTLVYSNPEEALKDLAQRGFLHVLCEGGLRLVQSLAQLDAIDEWIQITAPFVLGAQLIQESHIQFECGACTCASHDCPETFTIWRKPFEQEKAQPCSQV